MNYDYYAFIKHLEQAKIGVYSAFSLKIMKLTALSSQNI